MGPGSPAAPRAGLEAGPPGGGQEAAGGRRVAQVARIAEEAAEPGWAVVVSAAALEENPALQAVVSRWVEMAPSVVVFGDSPAARETIAANARLSWARSGQELLGILAGLEERRGVRSVTFLGSAERALPVAPLVQEIGLSLTVTPPSLTKLLAAFIPGPLAAELAAGLEQEEAFAGEA